MHHFLQLFLRACVVGAGQPTHCRLGRSNKQALTKKGCDICVFTLVVCSIVAMTYISGYVGWQTTKRLWFESIFFCVCSPSKVLSRRARFKFLRDKIQFWVRKIRDTRIIGDTHVNTFLAGTGDCQPRTGPRFRGPVLDFRQSNGPRPGSVLATDSVVPDR